MRGSRRVLALAAVLSGLQVSAVLLATRALAAPSPTPTPSGSATSDACALIRGPAKQYCEKGTPAPAKGGTDPNSTLDPLTSLAKGCADAAAWTIGKLSEAVTKTSQVDFTN